MFENYNNETNVSFWIIKNAKKKLYVLPDVAYAIGHRMNGDEETCVFIRANKNNNNSYKDKKTNG